MYKSVLGCISTHQTQYSRINAPRMAAFCVLSQKLANFVFCLKFWLPSLTADPRYPRFFTQKSGTPKYRG